MIDLSVLLLVLITFLDKVSCGVIDEHLLSVWPGGLASLSIVCCVSVRFVPLVVVCFSCGLCFGYGVVGVFAAVVGVGVCCGFWCGWVRLGNVRSRPSRLFPL